MACSGQIIRYKAEFIICHGWGLCECDITLGQKKTESTLFKTLSDLFSGGYILTEYILHYIYIGPL